MTDESQQRQAPEPFRAVLTAHRSLPRTGFLVVMGLLCVINFVVGVGFFILGAWPVLIFCGLDVLIIYIAFKLNYRSGRRFETVELTPELLTVTRIEPSGRRASYEFNPYWVRVDLTEHHDGRTELVLAHHEQHLSFGRFMNDDERRDFAIALRAALVRARGTVGF
jgi:uncharacterized membrane protein